MDALHTGWLGLRPSAERLSDKVTTSTGRRNALGFSAARLISRLRMSVIPPLSPAGLVAVDKAAGPAASPG